MSLFPTGVTVVTTDDPQGEAYGVTVSSFTSVSLDPQLILICLDNDLRGLDYFSPDRLFAVNILSESQEKLSNHFATPDSDRSYGTGYYEKSESGTPLLKDRLAAMECRLEKTYSAGDHTILVGEVISAHIGQNVDQKSPLLYYRGRYGQMK